MDVIWGGLLYIWGIFLWVLGKIWAAWFGTYLWLIPHIGEAGAFLVVTSIPVIIVLALIYMSIAKTQIGIETIGHSIFEYGLMAIGVILVIVVLRFILINL